VNAHASTSKIYEPEPEYVASVDDVEQRASSATGRRSSKQRADALRSAAVFADDLADVLGRDLKLDAGEVILRFADHDLIGLVDERACDDAYELGELCHLGRGERRAIDVAITIATLPTAAAATTVTRTTATATAATLTAPE
jgi:hypothetical protein